MPSTKDLAKAAACAFVPFVIVGLFILLLAMMASCSSANADREQAMLNAYDARLDRIEGVLFGGDGAGDSETLEDFEGRITAAEIMVWPAKIHAKDILGNPLEICVYPEVLSDGGFVINVHTEDDKRRRDGTCWGTVIYPGQAVEQRPSLSSTKPELGIVDGKKTAARMMAEEAGAVERTVIYHVDGTGKIYDITKPGNDPFVGRFTDEQFDRYFAARRKGDKDAMRRIIAEVTYGDEYGPDSAAAASDLEFPLPERPAESSDAKEARLEYERIRDANLSQNWRD